MSRPTKPPVDTQRSKKAPSPQGPGHVDIWLSKRLGELYKEVAQEPLPPTLDTLARQLEAKLKERQRNEDKDK